MTKGSELHQSFISISACALSGIPPGLVPARPVLRRLGESDVQPKEELHGKAMPPDPEAAR